MLRPEYLEQVPDRLIELYAEVEQDIIANMAQRIAAEDYFISSAQWQFKKLQDMGLIYDEILEKLSAVSGKRRQALEKLLIDAGGEALKRDSAIYRKAGLNPPALSASPFMQAVLRAGLDNTNGLFDNLTRTTANTATKQFERILDRAWLQVSSGAFDYNRAVKMAIKELASKGVAVITYPTGHTDYLETAVRRAVVTGVNQTALKMQGALADELGCDLVETSAHAGARPSHAEWQGRIFSRSGRHPRYPDFRASTGYGAGEGLGGWNCRHSFFPYFEGMEPVYTQAELDAMNAPKYEYNGQMLTEYEATQRQRYIERQIRRWKREFKAVEAAGQPTNEASAKISHWHKVQKDFLNQTRLKRQPDREAAAGFGKSEAAKVRGVAVSKERLDIIQQIEYNKKWEEIRELIRSPEINKKINAGAQNKHILGSKGYIPGRSYIYGDLETAQVLVHKYHGTGGPRFTRSGKWTKKEYISADHVIGAAVDINTLNATETKAFLIHYSKKGTHIVPTKEAISHESK